MPLDLEYRDSISAQKGCRCFSSRGGMKKRALVVIVKFLI